jgi:hypothetical protein
LGPIDQQFAEAVVSIRQRAIGPAERQLWRAQELIETALNESGTHDDDVIAWLLQKRIHSNLRGYEGSSEFGSGSEIFKRAVEFSAPVARGAVDEVFLRAVAWALSQHEAEFRQFHGSLSSTDSELTAPPIDRVRRAILRTSLRAYHQDKDLWLEGWRFTYIWPVCKPPQPGLSDAVGTTVKDPYLPLRSINSTWEERVFAPRHPQIPPLANYSVSGQEAALPLQHEIARCVREIRSAGEVSLGRELRRTTHLLCDAIAEADDAVVRMRDAKVLQYLPNSRVRSNLRGYETSKWFRNGLSDFTSGIDLESTPSRQAVDDLFLKTSVLSLSANEPEFDDLFAKYISKDPNLAVMSPEDVKRSLLRSSLRVYQNDEEEWRRAWKFTYIHPFCMPAGPNRLPKDAVDSIQSTLPGWIRE